MGILAVVNTNFLADTTIQSGDKLRTAEDETHDILSYEQGVAETFMVTFALVRSRCVVWRRVVRDWSHRGLFAGAEAIPSVWQRHSSTDTPILQHFYQFPAVI